MEQPRLGVQARRAEVVGDPDVGTEVDELVERGLLGRAGVGRGQHPERRSRLAVAAEGVEQGSDAAAADEGHDDVDAVGRLDLGPQLAPQVRLARRVGEQRRVEQRDQRLGDRLGAAIGPVAEDGVQHCRRIDWRSRGVDVDQVAESVEQRTSHLDADSGSFCFTDIGERTFDLTAEVPGDPIGGLGGVERPLLGRRSIGQRVQARLQPIGDEDFVQARRQLLHGTERYELAPLAAGIALFPFLS